MNSIRDPKAGWPTYEQELLIRACLLKGEKAILAWNEWRSIINIETLDGRSGRLLGLLYRNLISLGIQDSSMDRLRGVYRWAWVTNHKNLVRMEGLLKDLQNANIPTIVLKGMALLPAYYKDFGVRAMDDIDVLVPTSQVHETFALLLRKGRTTGSTPALFTDKYFMVRSSHNFSQSIDLHWHLLMEGNSMDADDDFWQSAVPITVGSAQTKMLCPTDQLMHTFVHGLLWNPAPPFRWVADAFKILQTSEINWERLKVQAEKRRLLVPVREAMRYLKDLLEDVPIPADAMRDFQSRPVSRLEQLEFNAKIAPPGLLDRLPAIWFRYLLYSPWARTRNVFSKFWRFRLYLQYNIERRNLWDLLRYALERIKARIWDARFT